MHTSILDQRPPRIWGSTGSEENFVWVDWGMAEPNTGQQSNREVGSLQLSLPVPQLEVDEGIEGQRCGFNVDRVTGTNKDRQTIPC